MRHIPIVTLLFLLSTAVLFTGCGDFLGAKPEKSLVVPSTTEDLQALLDNMNVFNSTPALEVVASDEYFTDADGWQSYGNTMVQQAYLRNFDRMFDGVVTAVEWSRPYQQVYYANTCLEKAEMIIPASEAERKALNNVKGSALFCRAFAFHNLVRAFGVQYDSRTSPDEKGIPLPLRADVTEFRPFSTLEETYSQILADIEASVGLLPELPEYKSRPSRAASHALAARVCLSMGDYANAVDHATSGLRIQGGLLDFNSLDTAKTFPVPLGNEEVIYHAEILNYAGFSRNQETRIDSLLYSSYTANDLRKPVYFVERANGAINFRGSFNGDVTLFSGLTVGELYLIRAESLARTGRPEEALLDLNRLLVSRTEAGKFIPVQPVSGEEVLDVVLKERKKEMVFRGMRWNDLKRFYLLGELTAPLVREMNGEKIIFEPGSLNFVFPVPSEETVNR